MSFRKPSFFRSFILSPYVATCRVYHQLSQYIAKLRRITIDLSKLRLVTMKAMENNRSKKMGRGGWGQQQVAFLV
jgi:hypothetical protein